MSSWTTVSKMEGRLNGRLQRRSCMKCGITDLELQQRRRQQGLPRAPWKTLLKPAPRRPHSRYCQGCLEPQVQAHIAKQHTVRERRDLETQQRLEAARYRQPDMTPRRGWGW